MKSISQALVKFQSQLKPVEKNAENPFFKSSYADLSSILAAVMPILSANGLAVMQPMKVQDGFTILKTVLIHESGESLESEMILPPHSDPQKYGALITYYKRYQIQAMLGINTEHDDDGNSVSNPVNNSQKSPASAPVNSPASDAQKALLKRLNVEFDPKISKNEASKLIEAAKEFK